MAATKMRLIDFLKTHKVPYVVMTIEISPDGSKCRDSIKKQTPKNWTKWDFDECMKHNEKKKNRKHIQVNLSASKFMVLDNDAVEFNDEFIKTFGTELLTTSISKGLAHAWFVKDENDNSTDSVKGYKTRPDLVKITPFLEDTDVKYKNIFERIDADIIVPDELRVFNFMEEHPKPVPKTELGVKEHNPTEREFFPTETHKIVLKMIVFGLLDHKLQDYGNWFDLSCAFKRGDIPYELYDALCRRNMTNYDEDENLSTWEGIDVDKHGFNIGSLHNWSKEKQPELYNLLIEPLIINPLITKDAHAPLSALFCERKPTDYLFCPQSGWYAVGRDNVWNCYEKYPPCLFNDVYDVLNKERMKEHQLLTKRKNFLEKNQKQLQHYEPQFKKYYDEDLKMKMKLRKDDPLFNKPEIIIDVICLLDRNDAFKEKLANKSFVDGVATFTKGIYCVNTMEMVKQNEKSNVSEIMDEQRHLFAFSDCVYDFNKRKTRPILPTDYIKTTSGYKFPHQVMRRYRDEVYDMMFSLWEKPEMIKYVLSIIALCVSGTRNVEEWYIWTGSGGNGKGMLMDLIKNAFGGYYYDLPNDILTKKIDKPSTPQPDLANCKGKRFLNTTEPEDNDLILEGNTKKMTGGDTITARGLYKDPISYKPQFGLTLQCNNIPALNGLTGGTERRLRLVPFPMQFKENPVLANERKANAELKNIKCRSSEWRDAFIVMLIETYHEISHLTSIPQPLDVMAKTREYIEDCNPVGNWFKENYEKADTMIVRDIGGATYERPCFLRPKDLLNAYRMFSGATITDKKFKESLAFNDVYSVKTSVDVRDARNNVIEKLRGVVLYKGWKEIEQPKRCLVEVDDVSSVDED